MHLWIVFLMILSRSHFHKLFHHFWNHLQWMLLWNILTNTFKHTTEPRFINIALQTLYLSCCYTACYLTHIIFCLRQNTKGQALFEYNAEGGKILVVTSVIIHCPRHSMGNQAHLLLVLQHVARFLGSKKGKNGRQNTGERRAGVRR